MNSFELFDVILFIGISQGLFLAVALQTVANKNKPANKILSIILFIAAFMLFGRIIYFRFSNQLLHRIAFSADTVIFIFGPLVYLYIRRLTYNEPKEYKLPLYHYIPALLFFVFISWSFFYTPKEFKLLLKSNHIQILFDYFFIQIMAIISNLYYLIKSYQLIKLYKKQEKNNLSYNQNVTSFLHPFLIVIFSIIILWLIGLFNKYLNINLSFLNYNMIWISIPILVYLVGYYSLKQPDIFRIQLKKTKQKASKKRLDDKILIPLQEKLEHLMDNEKIFLNSDLTLQSLSKKLETSSNNVSWLLNNVHNCTFYDYVNRYRVKAFINKIENGANKEYTLLALSMDSGFNSKSTFNKAFKSEMNDTPTNYIKNNSLG